MLAQINDGCAICRLVAQCVDPQIALRDLQIALRDRQIAQIRRLRLTVVFFSFDIRAVWLYATLLLVLHHSPAFTPITHVS